jgi:mannose/fructose/N-acetylgalactosamine-specific phosphotransferase system component IID
MDFKTLESENKNLTAVASILGSFFLLAIIFSIVKISIRLKGKSARKFF